MIGIIRVLLVVVYVGFLVALALGMTRRQPDGGTVMVWAAIFVVWLGLAALEWRLRRQEKRLRRAQLRSQRAVQRHQCEQLHRRPAAPIAQRVDRAKRAGVISVESEAVPPAMPFWIRYEHFVGRRTRPSRLFREALMRMRRWVQVSRSRWRVAPFEQSQRIGPHRGLVKATDERQT